ncbi:hypothetical protein CDAR_486391 [Caerostris darwini]|uniref:Uncharacterized protein n=1 Tax=Caerostris darwini TaxID=1538125 RepID=A0AAV4MEE6_9ARAC|nr:hypothetical protein CDAR_486391 [Caerostris darwini]
MDSYPSQKAVEMLLQFRFHRSQVRSGQQVSSSLTSDQQVRRSVVQNKWPASLPYGSSGLLVIAGYLLLTKFPITFLSLFHAMLFTSTGLRKQTSNRLKTIE